MYNNILTVYSLTAAFVRRIAIRNKISQFLFSGRITSNTYAHRMPCELKSVISWLLTGDKLRDVIIKSDNM